MKHRVKNIVVFYFILVYILSACSNEKIEKKNTSTQNIKNTNTIEKLKSKEELIKYKSENMLVDGENQIIHTIEIDLSENNIVVYPAFSFNELFGFEELSKMSQREKAYCAINAGFFYPYGEPNGVVVLDGEIVRTSTENYPIFLFQNNKAMIKNMDIHKSFLFNDKLYRIDSVNPPNKIINNFIKSSGVSYFTKKYGNVNRVNSEQISLSIENNIVKSINKSSKEVKISDGGLLTFINSSILDSIEIRIGDKLQIVDSNEFGKGTYAYGCGCWLVKDHKSVASDFDIWIGSLNNFDPRTAIGIKDNGNIVFIVTEGRRNDCKGMTAKQLAEVLIKYEIKDAAMLDGGSSSEMILNNKIVNKISSEKERIIAGGIFAKFK